LNKLIEFGEVIKWEKFQFRQFDSEIKTRWLICIGIPTYNFEEYHLISTTTQTYIDEIQKRQALEIYKNDYKFFDDGCYIYFRERPYSFSIYEIKTNINNIYKKGFMDNQFLKNIYMAIWAYKTIPLIKFNYVYECYVEHGIEVPKPSHIKKRGRSKN